MATIDDVRALIGDVVVADDTGEFLFSDEHLQTLLNLNNGLKRVKPNTNWLK